MKGDHDMHILKEADQENCRSRYIFLPSGVRGRTGLILSLLCIMLLVMIIFSDSLSLAQSTDDKPIVKLTTKLGVETTVSVERIYTDNDVLDYLMGWNAENFLLQVADGVYMVIPLRVCRQAELKGKMHVVTLTTDQQIEGKLFCTLESFDDKVYDLRNATKLLITNLPKEKPRQEKHVEFYQLHIRKPVDIKYSVWNLRFAFQYYSTAGYIMGGEKHETASYSFYLKIKNEEILANLSDFEEISFDKLRQKKDGDRIQMKLISKSGVETSGELILKPKDSSGFHEAWDWFLVAELADSNGILIVLSVPNCKINKILTSNQDY